MYTIKGYLKINPNDFVIKYDKVYDPNQCWLTYTSYMKVNSSLGLKTIAIVIGNDNIFGSFVILWNLKRI